jgi:hypothetical protein
VDDTDSSPLRTLSVFRCNIKTSLHCLLVIFTNLLGPVTWLLFSTPHHRMIERSKVTEPIVHPIGEHVRASFNLIRKAGSLVNQTFGIGSSPLARASWAPMSEQSIYVRPEVIDDSA